MTGTPSAGVERTASGLSMLMQNSAKILQTVCSNIDRDIIGEVLEGLFDMIMQFDKSGMLTGDEKPECLELLPLYSVRLSVPGNLNFYSLRLILWICRSLDPKDEHRYLGCGGKIGLPREDIVPSDEALEAQQKAAAAMAASQGVPGHAQQQPDQPQPGRKLKADKQAHQLMDNRDQ